MKSKTKELIILVQVFGLFLMCCAMASTVLAKGNGAFNVTLVAVSVLALVIATALGSMNQRLEALEAKKEAPQNE